jgi:hypothetical protein
MDHTRKPHEVIGQRASEARNPRRGVGRIRHDHERHQTFLRQQLVGKEVDRLAVTNLERLRELPSVHRSETQLLAEITEEARRLNVKGRWRETIADLLK